MEGTKRLFGVPEGKAVTTDYTCRFWKGEVGAKKICGTCRSFHRATQFTAVEVYECNDERSFNPAVQFIIDVDEEGLKP